MVNGTRGLEPRVLRATLQYYVSTFKMGKN